MTTQIEDGNRVRAHGVFAANLEDGQVYTVRDGGPFYGDPTWNFYKRGRLFARFSASSVRAWIRCVERGDSNGLELLQD